MSRYIDADVFEVFGYTSQDGTFDDGVQFVLEKIDEQPSADVTPVVHGEWLEDIAYYDDDGCPCIVARCSNCGEAYPTYNYCPNCGARMDEE